MKTLLIAVVLAALGACSGYGGGSGYAGGSSYGSGDSGMYIQDSGGGDY